MKDIYFDNSATTKLDTEVLQKMMPHLTKNYGNASSIYKIGRESRKAIEDAREIISNVLNCEPTEIYFTSGGTESDNTALRGVAYAYKNKGNHIITSKIEHPAILETCKQLEKEGFEITYLNVDSEGLVNPKELEKAIKPTTILVSIMYANNEIGTIEPIEEIGKITKKHKIPFHTDAVQAIGNEKIDVKNMNIDMLSMSAHKFYGPKGIGVLYVNKNIKFQKFMNGGHQERNKRAGTENVAGIVGMGKAIEIAYENLEKNVNKEKKLRDYYIEEVKKRIPYIRVNGSLEKRLPGNANISFEYIEGEGMLLNLDLKGIYASSGSACTSSSLSPSHVLLAIGVPVEVAHGSLRISIGKYNTKEEVDYLVNNLEKIVKKLRDMSPLYEDFLNSNKRGE